MPYVQYNPNPKGRHTGDCVIRALTIALGMSWDDLHLALSMKSFVDKTVLTDDATWGSYLHDHGFVVVPLINTCPDCYTIGQFSIDHPRGVYVVKTTGHVDSVMDGNYYDTTDTGNEVPIYYWMKE